VTDLDVFDNPTVPMQHARFARAGFTAIPNLTVASFFYGNGQYRATVRLTPKGAPVPLSDSTIMGLITQALTLREAFGLTDAPSTTAEEAA
jgi:hypothetical protein